MRLLLALLLALGLWAGQSAAQPVSTFVQAIAASGGSSVINNIQYGSVTISAATSATTTITSVNTSNAILFPLGYTSTHNATTGYEQGSPRLELTNATTVTAYLNTTNTGETVVANFVVVEFASGNVNSIQAGSFTLASGSTSTTQTITSVGSCSIAINLGWTINGSGMSSVQQAMGLELTNSTTLTGYKDQTSNAITVGYMVADLGAAICTSATNYKKVLSGNTSATWTQTLSPTVTANNALLIFNGCTAGSGASNFPSWGTYTTLTNGSTVTGTRTTTGSLSQNCLFMVWDIPGSVLNSAAQEGLADTKTNPSVTNTITSVSTTKTVLTDNGIAPAASAVLQTVRQRTTLTNATTVTTQAIAQGGSSSITTDWRLVEFK